MQGEAPVTAANLTFTYKSSLVATVDSISGLVVTANTPLTITGTNLGTDPALVRVFAHGKGAQLFRSRSRRAAPVYETPVN